MNANDYQKDALRTAGVDTDASNKNMKLIYCALGLSGEAGEFTDTVKKAQFHGHIVGYSELVKELGDALWYIAVAANALGVTLSEVMQVNIDKLKKRYPNGFSSEDSVKRVDVE